MARLTRFRRQLRFAQPASAKLQREARQLADRLDVVCPEVWVLPGPLSPMLWVLGRTPRLLVPGGLLGRLDEVQRQTLLAHELAHWRRRDHWVRWLELVVLAFYWWCPLVWWARRHLQEAEEECCDAWVVWLMPEAARGYALALVETLDFMASARIALPPVASGIGHVRLLKRRLKMIMRGTTPRTLTLGGFAVLALGALLLPLVPSWAQSQPEVSPGAEAPDPNLKALEKAQRDIRRAQEELERARQELERRTRELNQKMEQVRREAQQALERKNSPRAGQQAAGVGGFPGGGGFGGPGGFPAAGGFGGGSMGQPGFGGTAANPPANLDKRLREVERKLDLLIQMLRQGARPAGPGVPGGPAVGAVPPQGEVPLPVAPLPPRPVGGIGFTAPPGVPAIEAAPPAPELSPAQPPPAPTRRQSAKPSAPAVP
jgi:hypothetical protein